ncbi:hypothetical protein FF38_01142, partial [Lucilia cuprina]
MDRRKTKWTESPHLTKDRYEVFFYTRLDFRSVYSLDYRSVYSIEYKSVYSLEYRSVYSLYGIRLTLYNNHSLILVGAFARFQLHYEVFVVDSRICEQKSETLNKTPDYKYKYAGVKVKYCKDVKDEAPNTIFTIR